MLELTAGLLLVCGGDGDGAWSCWNILPPVLETVGSVRRDLATDPLLELSTAGYRYCALREDRRVMCMESNAASPQFAYVPGLPD